MVETHLPPGQVPSPGRAAGPAQGGDLGTAVPAAAPATATPAATSTIQPLLWHAVAPGLERAEVFVPVPPAGLAERLVLFRLNPAAHQMRVLYAPGAPATVAGWDVTARLVINAGYFDERNAATGLLVSDGQVWGQSYVGFGGMVSVDSLGQVRVRSLVAEPLQPGEALAQAVQAFPVLVRPDGTLYAEADEARARRTAIGQDRQGRVLVAIAPVGAFTLGELARWLARPELDLAIALNLDGGGSTGYFAGPGDMVDSLTPLPAVIAFYPAGSP